MLIEYDYVYKKILIVPAISSGSLQPYGLELGFVIGLDIKVYLLLFLEHMQVGRLVRYLEPKMALHFSFDKLKILSLSYR